MLDDGELVEHLGIVHQNHALVDLAPAVLDSRDIVQNRAVLPEGALLDIVDKPDGREVHVCRSVLLDRLWVYNVGWFRCSWNGALKRRRVGFGLQRPRELRGAEDVWERRVVVEAPYTVGAGGLKVIC